MRVIVRHAARGALFAGLALLVALACTRRPDELAFDNPLDPQGTGTPFRIEARPSGGAVLVSWRAAAIPGVTRYEVLRSLARTSGFTAVGNVTDARTQYVFQDTSYARNRVNYYKVRIYHGDARSDESQVEAAGVIMPPQATLAADTLFARSALVSVRSDIGDTVEISSAADFTGSVRVPRSGSTVMATLVFPPVPAAGTRVRAYARVWTSGVPGATGIDSAVVGLQWIVASRDTAVVDPVVVVRGRGRGADAMRVAITRAALAAAAWIPNPGSPAVRDTIDIPLALPPGLAPLWLYSESRSDYGFTRVDSLRAVPRVVAPSTIRLNNGAAVTSNRTIAIGSTSPWATQMRFAETSDLTGVAWQPFAATSAFELSAGPGQKTVYAQFRNGLDPTGQAAVATIELVGSAGGSSR